MNFIFRRLEMLKMGEVQVKRFSPILKLDSSAP
jgi:hypothetical protein